MTHSPRVSAVIPFYGEPEPVLAIIDTLRAQQGIDPADIEIVVSDDVSPTPFPEVEGVTVVRRPVNGGFGKAVNSGVAAATGEWVFILNSDLELDNTFVSRMLAAVERHGEVLASPQIIGHDGQQQWVARKFPTAGHIAWEWFTPLARFKPTNWWHRGVGHDVEACTGTSDAKVDWVMGACMVVPRAVFNRLGGMDERRGGLPVPPLAGRCGPLPDSLGNRYPRGRRIFPLGASHPVADHRTLHLRRQVGLGKEAGRSPACDQLRELPRELCACAAQ